MLDLNKNYMTIITKSCEKIIFLINLIIFVSFN